MAKNQHKIHLVTHPDYDANHSLWEKYRLVFAGGESFLKKYLKKFSDDEDANDFSRRKAMTPISSHASAAITDIKNAIYQRMVDIRRDGGPPSYSAALKGENNGVDRRNSTMTSFIGQAVLPDLVSIGKVGVLVERPRIEAGASRADIVGKEPYLVYYRAEDIKSWAYGANQELEAVLLRSNDFAVNADYGVTSGRVEVYFLYRLVKGLNGAPTAVSVTKFTRSTADSETWTAETPVTLNLKRIPFVIFELPYSLLKDVANHQIALINMASADIDYALRMNFPFYTEQVDPAHTMAMLQAAVRQQYHESGEAGVSAAEAELAQKVKDAKKVRTGMARGRTYPKGMDRPDYIAPPTGPLEASMKKEDQLVAEIRQLINLALSTIRPVHASAESKAEDAKGLEAGLSYIGLELERGERDIAKCWADYENTQDIATITYPQNYTLRTEEDRYAQAGKILEMIPKSPSLQHQRELAKEYIVLTSGHRVSQDRLKEMLDEIDQAEVIAVDSDVLRSDLEAGIISATLAAKARHYPEGDIELAKKEHAERLARIQAAQTSATQGVTDSDPAPGTTDKDSKRISQDPDNDPDGVSRTRGKGK